MADNLLQKIEERVLALLNELEGMRSEIIKLRSENAILRDDHGTHVEKLQGLITLLDVLDYSDSHAADSYKASACTQEEAVVA
jgi:regulator of replication initiation timing